MLTHPAEVTLGDHSNFYNEVARCGLEYGPAFRQVEHFSIDKSSAAIRWVLYLLHFDAAGVSLLKKPNACSQFHLTKALHCFIF